MVGQAMAVVATCNLDQWALDFDGNERRVIESIRIAHNKNAKFRTGPELELSGYGCEDHFLETDTFLHCWESLAHIITATSELDMLLDIGMPVLFKSTGYNCRVFLYRGRVLLVRPKMLLADDGNYRESRWFAPWPIERGLEEMILPDVVQDAQPADARQQTCPFGFGVVQLADCAVGCEACEELWAPENPHTVMALDGVDIIANGSGSHHELRKLKTRLKLIAGATSKSGGVYLYANSMGCDGGRLLVDTVEVDFRYFDGSSLIAVNGEVRAQGSQFAIKEVEVITANVDLEEVRSYRASKKSRCTQAAALTGARVPRVNCTDFRLCDPANKFISANLPVKPIVCDAMEEIAQGPACWLWDYLRRSGASGFFIPLSGGADSASVLAICGSMCQLVMKRLVEGDKQVEADVKRITASEVLPKTSQELANCIIHTAYLASKNSGQTTRDLAERIAHQVGSYHKFVMIDKICDAVEEAFTDYVITDDDGKVDEDLRPKYLSQGGTRTTDLALQNIQARSRMVMSFMLAQLLPHARRRGGYLLVLSTGNVDEALRGYLTKYDCSSGDINPIGSISKGDLKSFLVWASTNLCYPALAEIVQAPPTAELRPTVEGEPAQLDEVDMGMTYNELGWFGRLRKMERCGPVQMFHKLRVLWGESRNESADEVAGKVKHFFNCYCRNRHKCTVLTPSYHAEAYSPDDNRFDLRPFLYPPMTRQFRDIDTELVQRRPSEIHK
ncbi:Glutamine-dependent NAD(+) synthetase [Perkinsus olseni]|uniref:Glutamine-dependent NAD(+) synthetase n=1 Tax=Perkinsus olseni TaxID=32597 RepID=A0A7J6KTV6_PEROL|nr:Glutamine-dependent NAD(+) synthetase [Perkinsus olseni]